MRRSQEIYQTTSWWQATRLAHFGESGRLRLSTFIASRVVSGSQVSTAVGVALLGRAPSTTSSCARTTLALIHLDTARELLNFLDEALAKTEYVWRNMRDGIEPPAMQADASLLPRLGHRLTRVDGDGDDEHPVGSVCMQPCREWVSLYPHL